MCSFLKRSLMIISTLFFLVLFASCEKKDSASTNIDFESTPNVTSHNHVSKARDLNSKSKNIPSNSQITNSNDTDSLTSNKSVESNNTDSTQGKNGMNVLHNTKKEITIFANEKNAYALRVSNEPLKEYDSFYTEDISDKYINYYISENVPIYSNKVYVREKHFSALKSGKPLNIAFITDAHLYHTRWKESQAPTDISLKYAYSFADQIVLGGDMVECVSIGEYVNFIKNSIFKTYPNIVSVIGNHEESYGNDKYPTKNDLRKMIDGFWIHPTTYYSKVLDDRVMIVSLDDAREKFTHEQVESLKKDINSARKNNQIIFLFQHIGFDKISQTNAENSNIMKLVTENGDIIKGVFCGHTHVDSVVLLPASDGKGEKIFIPQYTLKATNKVDYHAFTWGEPNVLRIVID